MTEDFVLTPPPFIEVKIERDSEGRVSQPYNNRD